MDNGWEQSAQAWITDMGDQGDFGRHNVLDKPMLARVARLAQAQPVLQVLDVGCGEGRFCRALAAQGHVTVGIDPAPSLIAQAQARHPEGDYRLAGAEALPVGDGAFDLVVSYLSLIDIDDIETAIAEMVRVLRPGGRLLIANLNGFNTAAQSGLGWRRLDDGTQGYVLDHYLTPSQDWIAWRGIRIRNHHRPLSTYMRLLLDQGLLLTHFDEPHAHGGPPGRAERYNRAPWFLIMEWQRHL